MLQNLKLRALSLAILIPTNLKGSYVGKKKQRRTRSEAKQQYRLQPDKSQWHTRTSPSGKDMGRAGKP